MKKIRLCIVATLVAVSFAAVSCKESSKDKDDDDEKTEKVDKKKKSLLDTEAKEEKEITPEPSNTSSDGAAVDHFCKIVDLVNNRLDQATSEREIENIADEIDDLLDEYSHDTTPLSYTDKQAVLSSLSNMYGVLLQKYFDFSDEYVSDEDQYQVGYQLGQQLREVVNSSNTLSELYSNLDKFNDSL